MNPFSSCRGWRIRKGLGVLSLLLATASVAGQSAADLDRVAAVVEDEIITLSDLHWLNRYRRQQIPEDEEEKKLFYLNTLQQLIDQKLIASEALRTPGIQVTADEVRNRLTSYQQQFPSEEAFQQRLEEMEMSRKDLEELIERQLAVLSFVKIRFEPFIIIIPDQIQEYYQRELVAELQVAGQSAPPLALVEEQIRQILTVERTNQEMDTWVQGARKKARIEILLFRDPPFAPNIPEEFQSQIELQPLEQTKPPGNGPD
jgi:hypothetical protein